MNELKLGVAVKCVNSGSCYTTYPQWVNCNAPEYLDKYKNSQNSDWWNEITDYPYGCEGVVVQIAPHGEQDKDLYLVQFDDGKVFLLESSGLEAA